MALNEFTHVFNVKSQADELFKDLMKALKENDKVEIEAHDREKREITINYVISRYMLRKYKTFKVTVTITPKDDGDGSRVILTVKLEKIPDDIHVDHTIQEHMSFTTKFPAEELFKTLMNVLNHDDGVEIETEDWENKKATIKLICTDDILTNYKTVKITFVITPDGNDGSHVTFTGVFEM